MSYAKDLIRNVIPLRTSTFGKAKDEVLERLDRLQASVYRIETALNGLRAETQGGISRLSNDTREIFFRSRFAAPRTDALSSRMPHSAQAGGQLDISTSTCYSMLSMTWAPNVSLILAWGKQQI